MAVDYPTFLLTVTQLRSNAAYQAAEMMRRKASGVALASADQGSPEFAAFLLLIGTWQRIGILARMLDRSELHRLFKCTPAKLMWGYLSEGVERIGNPAEITPDFLWLVQQYDEWQRTEDGSRYSSQTPQIICAMFG